VSKIAIVHPSLAVRGGAENVVLWLAAELQRRGHAVTVIASDYDEMLFGPRETHPFRLQTLPLGGYGVDPLDFLRAGRLLREVLPGFDWINPHNFPAYLWTFAARAGNPRVGPIVWFCEEPMRWFYPEVCNPHMLELRRREEGMPDLRRSWRRSGSAVRHRVRHWRWEVARVLDRLVVPRLDGVIANSEFIAGQVRRIFGRPAQVCHLGIPTDRFPNTAPVETTGRYLLTVSRLFPEKNIETILAAVRLLRDRGPLPFDHYVIVGDGPLRARLEARARELDLAGVVEFAGAVSEQELADLYRRAALVAYLPLDETFGLVFLEAALFRRPVLGPNHGGPAEVVRHGVTGLTVDPLNPARIAAAIEEAMTDRWRLDAWGAAGYDLVMREFTLSKFVDRFEAAVSSVIAA
jgi:glycosyltransferase involved in cell wall biosynthesis